jgi:branched-chain amino acid transport system permease protein
MPMLGAIVLLLEIGRAVRTGAWAGLLRTAITYVALPLAVLWATMQFAAPDRSLWLNIIVTLILVVPMGPMVYRIVYQPLAEATVLVLLIVSVALHFALMGLALVFFGAEGWRTPPFVSGQVDFGFMTWSAQSLFVVGTCAALIIALWLFFGKTLYGRALRATAVNRRGARLVGISTTMSGTLTFTLAVAIGVVSGMLIAPVTTVYYDTGFLIGLKGFVGAIIGGLVSYPVAAAGALLVGILEAFSSFWASAYKEVIVFTLIIPVLLWRSFGSHHVDDEE